MRVAVYTEDARLIQRLRRLLRRYGHQCVVTRGKAVAAEFAERLARALRNARPRRGAPTSRDAQGCARSQGVARPCRIDLSSSN